MIKFEYWIKGNKPPTRVKHGMDNNQHNDIAANLICKKYFENLIEIAKSSGLSQSYLNHIKWFPDKDIGQAYELLLMRVINSLKEKQSLDDRTANNQIMLMLGVDKELYDALADKDNAMIYVEKYFHWIAVRQQNIELWGLDASKAGLLRKGLERIFDKEGIINPNDLEFVIEDRNTNRTINRTYQQILDGEFFTPSGAPIQASGFVPYPKGYKHETILSLNFKGFLLD